MKLSQAIIESLLYENVDIFNAGREFNKIRAILKGLNNLVALSKTIDVQMSKICKALKMNYTDTMFEDPKVRKKFLEVYLNSDNSTRDAVKKSFAVINKIVDHLVKSGVTVNKWTKGNHGEF